jgi:hypothetical protein
MKNRSIKIAVITAGLATAPMLSVAANTPVAMDNCLKAFMASLSTSMTKPPKLLASHYIDNSSDEIPVSALTMLARDAQDNHMVARAQCKVNSAGEVIDLHREPLRTIDPL